MPLSLKQIEFFRAVMVAGSVSGAAKLLYVSQPAISRLIAYTEQRLGLTLFERVKGRLYPTPEARILFVEVNAVYQGVLRVNEVVDDLIQHRTGHLRIACSPNLGLGPVPGAIRTFQQNYPEAEIILHTMLPGMLQQAVLNQQAELGIAFSDEWHPNLHARPLYQNRVVAALPDSHPLVQKSIIDAHDLIEQPFISYSQDIPLGLSVRNFLAQKNVALRPKIEVQQAHVACALVQAGAGIALVDEITAKGLSWTHIIFRPITACITTPISIIHGMYTPLSSLAQEFISALELVELG